MTEHLQESHLGVEVAAVTGSHPSPQPGCCTVGGQDPISVQTGLYNVPAFVLTGQSEWPRVMLVSCDICAHQESTSVSLWEPVGQLFFLQQADVCAEDVCGEQVCPALLGPNTWKDCCPLCLRPWKVELELLSHSPYADGYCLTFCRDVSLHNPNL